MCACVCVCVCVFSVKSLLSYQCHVSLSMFFKKVGLERLGSVFINEDVFCLVCFTQHNKTKQYSNIPGNSSVCEV